MIKKKAVPCGMGRPGRREGNEKMQCFGKASDRGAGVDRGGADAPGGGGGGQVTNMGYMFYNCSGLTSLDVNRFDTGKVTNMSYMFCNCSGLTKLDISSFDAGQVTDMNPMISGCSGLTILHTPVHIMSLSQLPSGKWYLDGTKVYELPKGLDYSVQIVREGTTPEEKPGTLPDTLAMDDTGVHAAVFCMFAALTLLTYRLKKKQ